jgi:hypothetical protein
MIIDPHTQEDWDYEKFFRDWLRGTYIFRIISCFLVLFNLVMGGLAIRFGETLFVVFNFGISIWIIKNIWESFNDVEKIKRRREYWREVDAAQQAVKKGE